MDELVECVLSVGAWLAPDDRTGRVVNLGARSGDVPRIEEKWVKFSKSKLRPVINAKNICKLHFC